MNIAQIDTNLQNLIAEFKKETFIFDLLLAYGTPKASIARLHKSGVQHTGTMGEELLIRKKLYFKVVASKDLQQSLEYAKLNEKVKKQDPRFIVLTDYETLLAYDTKTTESLDIPLMEITQSLDFFLPWAGMEKHKGVDELEADVKAAERMAKLYDEITKENPLQTHEEVHNLNVFLSRLLFCFFAEDTGIFEENQFSLALKNHTQEDGSDLNDYLDNLFLVLNTPHATRSDEVFGRDVACRVSIIPTYLAAFPYVNGGLFRNHHTVPVFTQRSRRMLLDCGMSLQWRDINPDIFGSMIQAVITPEHRGGLGMHYTSVPNIMKVIEPLFLNELKEEFESAKGNKKKLNDLLKRIWKIKIFDPACGSGNFLIIAYKELRKLEMDIFNELGTFAFSEISLSNFYGIEIDDFAHEVATLSLWLAEHQMNQIFKTRFGDTKPALPLKESGNIVQGNACRLDWEVVCPKLKDDEIYILGNPPYLGYALQSSEQRSDMAFVFKDVSDYKKLDFISCWFYLGSLYIQNFNSKFAFVSTNSISQGEQVAIMWPNILNSNIEIAFAYQSFKWKNNAKAVAGVTVVIIGLANKSNKEKKLFVGDKCVFVKNINAYLVASSNIIVNTRNNPLSHLPEMIKGSSPSDGGNLILNEVEAQEVIKYNPIANTLIKRYLGADEFLYNKMRYCIWVENKDVELAYSIEFFKKRFEKCRFFRLASKKEATKRKADIPHEFDEKKFQNAESIIIPQTTSELRDYIPIGFLNSDVVVSNAARVIYNAKPWHFAVLTSKIHKSWVNSVAGRLETRIQYSNTICYNTFPFPRISDNQKNELEKHVYNILAEREKHSEKTLAQLYDPDKMPEGLREAHRLNDMAVERCYRNKPFESDEERLEYLFKLYEQMIAEEKEKGTLFEGEKKKKMKK